MQRGISIHALGAELMTKTNPTLEIIWSIFQDFQYFLMKFIEFSMNDLRGPLAVTWLTVYRQLQVMVAGWRRAPWTQNYLWQIRSSNDMYARCFRQITRRSWHNIEEISRKRVLEAHLDRNALHGYLLKDRFMIWWKSWNFHDLRP